MLPDGQIMPRQFQFRPDVSERLQNEAPQMQSRMRHDECGLIADEVSGVEQIEIQRARRILLPLRRTTKRLFDGGEMGVQFVRRARGLNLDHGIQKRLRARRAIDRLRLINAAAGNETKIRDSLPQQFDTSTQISSAIADV